MQEINRHEFPPGGGWKFTQSQTGWTNPLAMVSFSESVKAIIKHRNANPAITAKHNLSTDFNQVADELENFTRKRLGLPIKGATAPFLQAPSQLLSPSVQAAVAGAKKVADGAALLLDWEVSGQSPVAPEVSAARAAVCAGCPKNTAGDFTAFFTQPAAALLRKRLERLHSMKLATPSDDKLHVCIACECPLRLKVHTPLDLVMKWMKPATKAELWEKCWITHPA